VPDVAHRQRSGRALLLVVNGENIVEQRKVRVGPLEGGLRVIEEGLKPDDRVITAGLAAGDSRPEGRSAIKTIEAQPASAK
jgi:multidrug efflux pump subunit AcrA (membrane-fusion protein)